MNETNNELAVRVLSREAAIQHVKELGWDSLLDTIQMVYHELDIYTISKDWYKSDQYNIKCRGTKGDVLIKLVGHADGVTE